MFTTVSRVKCLFAVFACEIIGLTSVSERFQFSSVGMFIKASCDRKGIDSGEGESRETVHGPEQIVQ